MLGIGYVAVRRIPCICFAFLNKIYSPWNRIQDKYNQYQYTGENQQCVYCPILGSYHNWQIIHFIYIKIKHEAIKSGVNVHIENNFISDITLKLTDI